MTPSIILLYICSAVFVALLCVFCIFLIKTAGAARARQVTKKSPAGISKQMLPADPEITQLIQSRYHIAKAK